MKGRNAPLHIVSAHIGVRDHIKPFWDDSCPVKGWSEGNGFEHCGTCGEFPCVPLNQFAYDKEQGGDGARARIEQCREWAVNA